MITIRGHHYGTATEIAHRLGPDITPQRVRDWARRSRNPADRLHGLLPAYRIRRTHIIEIVEVEPDATSRTFHRLDQAAEVECLTRTSTRGRPRRAA